MKILKIAAVLSSCMLASMSAYAESDVVKERKALMKSVGGAMGLSVKMVKGAVPYDAAKAEEALKKMVSTAEKFPGLLKEGTDMTKEQTSEASPKIWENTDDFKKKMEAFKLAAMKSAEASKQGKGALAGTLKALGGTCAACHKAYRVKKQ